MVASSGRRRLNQHRFWAMADVSPAGRLGGGKLADVSSSVCLGGGSTACEDTGKRRVWTGGRGLSRRAITGQVDSRPVSRPHPCFQGRIMVRTILVGFIITRGGCGTCSASITGTLMAIENLLKTQVDENLTVETVGGGASFPGAGGGGPTTPMF